MWRWLRRSAATRWQTNCVLKQPAQQNYVVGEQELLAVIHAVELWWCYLNGVEFTVVTDHSLDTFFCHQHPTVD